MKDFLTFLMTTWWGIFITVVVCILIWTLISCLLYKQFFKRFYDVILSGLAIILLSPVFVIVTFLVWIKLGSPLIFKQYRPGKNGKIFIMKKFRTMTNERDKEGNLLSDEERMTKLGRFLRSTSLDELPEIWNIFIGQMSIIGPRPQLVKDLTFMDETISRRHKVRGGLTGLAQVNGRNNLTWEERFEYDLKYVNRVTFFGDMKIFFKTILRVLKRSDVATNGMETSEDYGDYLLRLGRITKEEYENNIEKAKLLIDKYKRNL